MYSGGQQTCGPSGNRQDERWHAIEVGSMELQESGEKTTDLVPYKRGILPGEVARGTLVRFLPGSVIGMGALSAIIPPGGLGGLRSQPVQSMSSEADFVGKCLFACLMTAGLRQARLRLTPFGQAPTGTSSTPEAVEPQPTGRTLFESKAHGPSPREPES